MNFQKICIIIACVLLVILFSIIAVSFNSSYSKAIWPPIIANCPDYWNDLNGDGTACVNVKGLGNNSSVTSKTQQVDFTNYSSCNKYNYCNTNEITWDGISYGYGLTAPCDNT